ncbi:MAG: hypothetical protein ABI768_09590 [Acidobacteriota bacterium]
MTFATEDDIPEGEVAEVAPGVVVERRSFLAAAALALAGVALPGRAENPLPKSRAERWTLEEFLAAALPVARELVRDTSVAGQDVYLLTLASFAVRLGDVALPEMKESGQGAGTTLGFHPSEPPIAVLHWKMSPGSSIRLHAHTYGNVCTIGLEGEARLRNFEMVGPRDFEAKGTIRIRCSNDQILGPGRTNLVSLERGYVHGFTAGPLGARGLDLTTRIQNKRPFPWLEVGDKPVDAARAIYEGRWVS